MLNDTYSIRDLEAAQRALHGKTVTPGSSPLPVEVRVAEAIARARDEAAQRVDGELHLSVLDRANVRRELECRVSALDDAARRVGCVGAHDAAQAARARAQRVRELITFFMALALCLLGACSGEQPPPPYAVYFASNVPQADREVWGAAAGDWSKAVGEYVFLVGAEPAHGRCGVEIVLVEEWDGGSPAWSWIGDCLTTIEYVRGELEPCIALHELGHQLLGRGHVAGTVMDEWGCDYAAKVTPDLAGRVRQKWGMP